MSVEEQVRDHFDADARRFDQIYEPKKGPVGWLVDEVWRGVVRKRFELTLERLSPLDGMSVLDVGCGSGRYCVAFALKGAERVVGIDFAQDMLDLAERHATEAEVAAACEFRRAEFPGPGVADGERFDYATAMGYFDYVSDPVSHLERIRELTTRGFVASFPKSSDFRAPVRRVRFKFNRCPLYLYSREAGRVAAVRGRGERLRARGSRSRLHRVRRASRSEHDVGSRVPRPCGCFMSSHG